MRLIEFLKKLWRYILSLFAKRKKKCPIGIKESFSDFIDQYKKELEDGPIKSIDTSSDGQKIKVEIFSNIASLLRTLKVRPKNSVMISEYASVTGNYDFCGTHSYEEAEELLIRGDEDIISKIQKGYTSKIRKFSTDYSKRVNPNLNSLYGSAPNIARSIIGLPDSMILPQRVDRKMPCINIVYYITTNCTVEPKTIIDSGVTLITAIQCIELKRISVKLTGMFYSGQRDSEIIVGGVILKNYSEKLSISRLSFPIAHPSMLRRIGFKYLETHTNLESSGFAFGYGSPLKSPDIELIHKNDKNTVSITVDTIQSLKFNPKLLINYIKEHVKK